MVKHLSGQVALVTGAGSGIGLAITRAFLDNGSTVIAGDINLEGLNKLPENESLIPVALDVRSTSNIEQVVNDIIRDFGHIDILVNNAAIVRMRSSFLSVSDDDWAASIEVNFLGYVRSARATIPHMAQTGRGTIIHMASEAALMPNMALPDYSVLKSSVLNLSKVIAREFGKAGIRSNVVSPGYIRTPIYDRPGGLGDMLERKYGVGREAAYARYVDESGVVSGRLGTAEEVASLVNFLVSKEAAFITGANYLVDGGVTPFI